MPQFTSNVFCALTWGGLLIVSSFWCGQAMQQKLGVTESLYVLIYDEVRRLTLTCLAVIVDAHHPFSSML